MVGDGGFGVAGGFAGAGEEERRLDDLEPMVGVAAVLLLRRPGDAAARFDGLREGFGEGGIMINYRRRLDGCDRRESEKPGQGVACFGKCQSWCS